MALSPNEKKELDINSRFLAQLLDLKKELESHLTIKGFRQDDLARTSPDNAEFLALIKDKLENIDNAIRNTQEKINVINHASQVEEKFNKIIEKIKVECSDAISAYRSTNSVLYRGSSSASSPNAFVGNSPTNRKPMTSDKGSQEIYDYALEKMGIKARRGNSIFTTTSISQASSYAEYGKTYIIFPKNGFNFSWTPGHEDTILRLYNVANMELLSKIASEFENRQIEDYNSAFSTLKHQLSTNRLEGLNAYLSLFKKFNLNIKISMDEIVNVPMVKETYNPIDESFENALRSGGEVLINGEYYAFNRSVFEEYLKKSLDLTIIRQKVDDDDY